MFDKAPMQYTANFNGCKNDSFQLIVLLFLIFALNTDCWFTLEPPQSMF